MSTPLRILGISGSLRARSTNLLLLETAALLAPPQAQLEIFTRLADIPPFQPDTPPDIPPAAVAALRHAVSAADAVVFSVPEYAHGLPGALKNALDWLVDGIEFTHKPVALFNASAALRLRTGGAARDPHHHGGGFPQRPRPHYPAHR